MKFFIIIILKNKGKAIAANFTDKICFVKKNGFGYYFKNWFQIKMISAAIYNRLFVYQLICLNVLSLRTSYEHSS